MIMYGKDDRLHIFISINETICFGKLVSYLHKLVNTPVSVFITFEGRSLKGLDVVENFEVLLDHTPVTEVTLIMEPDNPKYSQIERVARFIWEVYGYKLNLITGIGIKIIEGND